MPPCQRQVHCTLYSDKAISTWTFQVWLQGFLQVDWDALQSACMLSHVYGSSTCSLHVDNVYHFHCTQLALSPFLQTGLSSDCSCLSDVLPAKHRNRGYSNLHICTGSTVYCCHAACSANAHINLPVSIVPIIEASLLLLVCKCAGGALHPTIMPIQEKATIELPVSLPTVEMSLLLQVRKCARGAVHCHHAGGCVLPQMAHPLLQHPV